MQSLKINTATGFNLVTFYLKYDVMGGMLPNGFNTYLFNIEVCGAEIITCNDMVDNRILLQNRLAPLVIPAADTLA